MKFDWDSLEQIEMTRWLLPANRVFPYPVVIHGSRNQPNPQAQKLATEMMTCYEMFTGAARVHLEAFINPNIVEDGLIPDAFCFDDYGNSFQIHFNLESDQSAHWAVRFVRLTGDHITDFTPCELVRSEQ
ncbi:MAG: hypothetical protein PVJ98_11515 [Akkermansiaceae bacterium]